MSGIPFSFRSCTTKLLPIPGTPEKESPGCLHIRPSRKMLPGEWQELYEKSRTEHSQAHPVIGSAKGKHPEACCDRSGIPSVISCLICLQDPIKSHRFNLGYIIIPIGIHIHDSGNEFSFHFLHISGNCGIGFINSSLLIFGKFQIIGGEWTCFRIWNQVFDKPLLPGFVIAFCRCGGIGEFVKPAKIRKVPLCIYNLN